MLDVRNICINVTKIVNDHIFQIITPDGKKIVVIACSTAKEFKKELEQKYMVIL